MNIFFVRQGIYDRKHKINAYELLFDKDENRNKDREEAELQLVCNCGTIGLSHFTNNKKAFINFSEIALLEDIPSLLGKDLVVVQIAQDYILNSETKEAIKELRSNDFTIVVNDVNDINKIKEFGDLINIYRINFSKTTKSQRISLIREIEKINTKAIFMASGVKTEDEYNEAVNENYYYFQGDFLSNPVRIKDKETAVRNVNRFNIIIELLKDDFEVSNIEYIIKSDIGISYKLMRFLNSAAFSFVQRINSIRQAIMLLGKDELKKWLTLIAISEMQIDENEELSSSTIIRGRLCELIAENIDKEKKSQAFLVGLFSNLVMFVDKNIDDIVEELPIDYEIKEALKGNENLLNDILMLVEAYEKMDYDNIGFYSEKIQLDKSDMLQLYMDAIDWANQLTVNFR